MNHKMMVDYADALICIKDEAKKIGLAETEQLPIQKSIGRINAETIVSNESLPAFNNSAMDGFALVAEQTSCASEAEPLDLKVNQVIAAGDNISEKKYQKYEVAEIMTGAVVPSEYDAVVPVENVEVNSHSKLIRIIKPVKSGKNIRLMGEDIFAGNTLFEKGNRITPKHIMALAAVGIDHINVYRKPKVTLICTGKELKKNINSSRKSSDILQPGQIRNSNGPYLEHACAEAGCDVNYRGGVSDDPKRFLKDMDSILTDQPDIIITTGAVSMGKWDFIPKVLANLDAKLLFHKVKIRPGKPILFAKFKSGLEKTGPLFFGLPGNPVSSIVGFRFFVMPLLRTMLGLPVERPTYARLTMDFEKKSGLRYFLKAKITSESSGELKLDILPGQESFKMTPLLQANCWAVLNEGREQYKAGDIVEVYEQ